MQLLGRLQCVCVCVCVCVRVCVCDVDLLPSSAGYGSYIHFWKEENTIHVTILCYCPLLLGSMYCV